MLVLAGGGNARDATDATVGTPPVLRAGAPPPVLGPTGRAHALGGGGSVLASWYAPQQLARWPPLTLSVTSGRGIRLPYWYMTT